MSDRSDIRLFDCRQATNLSEFFAKINTPEMAQKIARRLGKPHGVFADFAARWVEAMGALEEELRNG